MGTIVYWGRECARQAVEIARELKPRQTYFTHMSHELEHEATNASLPIGMALGVFRLPQQFLLAHFPVPVRIAVVSRS